MIINIRNGFLLCIQFFTIIPYNKEVPWERHTIQWCLIFFPIIGLFIGLIGWLQYWSFTMFTPISTLFISFWLLFYFIAITGGLHLDGWMDCSDAFFSYQSKEKRVEIMEDPRVGSFAVLSVLFLLGFRFLFIYETVHERSALVMIAILIIPILSRAMVVWMLVRGKLAKERGLAAHFQNQTSKQLPIGTSVFTLAIVFLIGGLFQQVRVMVLLLIVSSLFLVVFYLFCKKQFGGVNGDTQGALIEGGETFLWFVLWLLHYFVMV